jgi:hypothetical protein
MKKMLKIPRGYHDNETIDDKSQNGLLTLPKAPKKDDRRVLALKNDTEYVKELMEECDTAGVFQLRSLDALYGKMAAERVGGGSFDDVFRLLPANDVEMDSSHHLIKLIPIKACDPPHRHSGHTEIVNAAGEARVARHLDVVEGFCQCYALHVTQGKLTEALQKAKDAHRAGRGRPNTPDEERNENQLWLVIEMDDAGTSLYDMKYSSIFMIWDIFWGVTMALARAEAYLQFEVSLKRSPRSNMSLIYSSIET